MKKIGVKSFGKTKNQEDVNIYTITNNNGMVVELLSYGATVRSIAIPTESGLVDVALGYDTLAEYEEQEFYLGATVGRFANRIGGGKFSLKGKEYELAVNNSPNHLHGGLVGFDKKVWTATLENDNAVVFSRISFDGEEGYPATFITKMIYKLTEANALDIEYWAVADDTTIANLTNHTYFNLDGSGTILDHTITIHADQFTPIDATGLPTGEILDVTGTPFDFRNPKLIKRDIDLPHPQLINSRGYDHNFVLPLTEEADPNSDEIPLILFAEVSSSKTNISMKAFTNQRGVQLYTGNFLDGSIGRNNHAHVPRSGFCLETQCFPDALAHEEFPSPILPIGQIYLHKTIYQFET